LRGTGLMFCSANCKFTVTCRRSANPVKLKRSRISSYEAAAAVG
jgi:hypothetical protein